MSTAPGELPIRQSVRTEQGKEIYMRDIHISLSLCVCVWLSVCMSVYQSAS